VNPPNVPLPDVPLPGVPLTDAPQPSAPQTNAPGLEPAATAENSMIAYRIPGWSRYPEIVPAPADRDWMDTGTKGWANRCLPLRMANQAGWCILNDADFDVIWDGKNGLESLKILPQQQSREPIFANSMFGYGILTISIPFLFRMPPLRNLMVRGPANFFKDGAAPLEGLVEADWTPYTFTMNWKITRARQPVRFAADEPICMLTPVPRGELNQFRGEIRNLQSDPELLAGYTTWHQQRVAREKQRMEAASSQRQGVQGHYIRGQGYLGEAGSGHQTKLSLKPFTKAEPPILTEPPASHPASEVAPSKGWWQKLVK
jgi:hypothetical protein